MEQITTARLFMRQFSESDVTEEYVAALNDPEIVRFTEARHTRWTTEKVVQYVKQSNQVGRFELYGMFVKTTDKHIGNIRLSGFSAQHNRMDLGIMIPSAGPSITDVEVRWVAEAAQNGWYQNMNLYLAEFEKQFSEYTGMKFCLATPNCTSAIHLAVLGLGVGSGDEVIVPDITWVASAAPVCYAGARPVFVDIDPQSWCLTAESVERAITPRTKAIVAVGLLGNMPQMNEIRSVASRHRIPIIEDAAESIGAEYNGKKAGTCGKGADYNFNGTKLMVTGEGG